METLTWTGGHDRTRWGAGPWDGEPDKTQWRDPATGLPCLAVRGPLGAWCGYVAVAPAHPAFGLHYDGGSMVAAEERMRRFRAASKLHATGVDALEAFAQTAGPDLDDPKDPRIADIAVHGGLTFSGECAPGGPTATNICHYDPDGPPAWWFGFDCPHGGDWVPDMDRGLMSFRGGAIYRDLSYVRGQCESLAAQLAAIEGAALSTEETL